MSNLIDRLSGQHREGEKLVADMGEAVAKLRAEGIDTGGLLEAFAAYRTQQHSEVDGHFREEEQGLFPVLGRYLGIDVGPVAAMMDDHHALRCLQLELDAALAALEFGHREGWEASLARAAESFSGLLGEHISKEDTMLFPMALSLLSEDEWEQAQKLAGMVDSA